MTYDMHRFLKERYVKLVGLPHVFITFFHGTLYISNYKALAEQQIFHRHFLSQSSGEA